MKLLWYGIDMVLKTKTRHHVRFLLTSEEREQCHADHGADRLYRFYPIERALRCIRLGMIWTGTSEIMNLMIQHEYFDQVLDPSYDRRKMEDDAMHPDDNERCHTDDDMQRIFNSGKASKSREKLR